jgi:hypothetical protein
MNRIITLLLVVGLASIIIAQEQPKETNLPDELMQTGDPDDLNKIYDRVEMDAQFSNDHRKLNPWVKENISTVQKANPKLPHGVVKAKFVVEKNGTISTLSFVGKVNGKLKEQTTKLINQMPKWRPAQQNGRAVRSYVTIDFEW